MWPFTRNIARLRECRDVRGLVRALAHRDDALRTQAAEALGDVDDPAAVAGLRAAFRDDCSAVRAAAARALGRLRYPGTAPDLSYRLADPDPGVRSAAEEALVAIGGPAADVLCDNLETFPREAVGAVVDTLVAIGGPAAPALCLALRSDLDRARTNAAEALARIGGPAVKPLSVALGHTDPCVREAAAEVLGRTGDPSAVALLSSALRDVEGRVREAAAEALTSIGVPHDPAIRAWHAAALGDWASAVSLGSAAVGPLCGLLSASEWEVQRAAVEALGEIGDPRAAEPLYAVASKREPSWTVGVPSEVVTRALARLRPPAVKQLCALLEHQHGNVREAAAQALSGIGVPDDPAVQAWHAIASGDPERAASLGPAAVVPLCAALEHTDKAVVAASAEALGLIGDPRAVRPLCAAVRDKLCRASMRALVRIGSPAVEPLCELLSEKTWLAERDVPPLLAEIGDPRAIEPLRAVLPSTRYVDLVRCDRAEALGMLGDAAGVEWLCEAMQIGRLEERRDAAEALRRVYHCGKLNEAGRRTILEHRQFMARPHDDHWEPAPPGQRDCGPHVDHGIGVDL